MKPLHVLYAAAELAPLTGDGALAKENHFLARALSELGLELTLVVPAAAVPDPGRFGLAKRLSPLSIPGEPEPVEIAVHEGSLPGGRVSLFTIGLAPGALGDDLDPGGFASAALALAAQRDAWPTVVIAGHGSEQVVIQSKTRAPEHAEPPVTFFTLRRVEPSPELRDALAHSDRIMVPSRAWAEALRQLPDRDPWGALIAPVRGALRGVMSGMDALEWNPGHDSYLTREFARDPQAGKAHHKHELQRALGLRRSPRSPLVAMSTPVDGNVLTYVAASTLGQQDVQIAVLADRGHESSGLRHLERLANQDPGKVTIRSFADQEARRAFEHQLMAAADFQLIAHMDPPGPLCELYGMHYGAIPIAPAIGIYADALVEFDSISATGSGFLFAPDEPDQLASAALRALRAYGKPESFAVLVQRAMSIDLSWRTTAQRYAHFIAEALREHQSTTQAAAAV